jgi:hypothetical protein
VRGVFASLVPVAALALGACSGPAELSLGATGSMVAPATKMVFIAPGGVEHAPGTRERPLKTFAEALSRLRPGSTLTLLDGVYDGANGPLKAKCDDVNVFSGTDDLNRIVVKADTERGAWLRGDGAQPPIDLEDCRFWTLDGLRVESSTVPTPAAPEGGSVVVLRANDRDIVLRRLLARLPNPNADANVVTIGPGCSYVLVEECELYDFTHNAVEATRAGPLTLRRNYVNSRNAPGGTVSSMDADRGDYGFLFEETHDVLAENNLVENVHTGFAIVGRDANVDAPAGAPVANNRLLGNVVLKPAGVGVRIDSRCLSQNPCPASRTVVDTQLSDDIVIGGAAGVSNAGAVNTRVQQVTIRDAANGVLAIREPQNVAVRSTWSTVNALAVVQNSAFKVGPDEAQWAFDHCAAASSNPAALYVTLNGNPNGTIMASVPVPPDLGECLVALPAASPLRRAGAAQKDVGASVIDQYRDGVLTPGARLWLAGTRAFVGCGAVVDGVNRETGDSRTESCQGVHARLKLAACDVLGP